jgi:hypothetical protein
VGRVVVRVRKQEDSVGEAQEVSGVGESALVGAGQPELVQAIGVGGGVGPGEEVVADRIERAS